MSEEASPPTGTDTRPRPFTPNVQLSAYGRLTRDPEAKTSERGHPYARARIACNVTPAKREGNQQTWYVDVIAFRNQAAALAKCRQGQGVKRHGNAQHGGENEATAAQYQNFTVTADAVMGAATTRRTE